jgi:hypothetical protein
MDEETITKVNQIVYADYPYLEGILPDVQLMDSELYSVIYKGQVETASGHPMPVSLRLTVDQSGKILKMVSSR